MLSKNIVDASGCSWTISKYIKTGASVLKRWVFWQTVMYTNRYFSRNTWRDVWQASRYYGAVEVFRPPDYFLVIHIVYAPFFNMSACLLSTLPTHIYHLPIHPSNHPSTLSSIHAYNHLSIHPLLLTIARPVIVSSAATDVENRVYGFRFAALFPIQCEVPASTRSGFSAIVWQLQVTVPLNMKHCVVVFLFDVTILEQGQADTSQPVTRRAKQSMIRHRIITTYVW